MPFSITPPTREHISDGVLILTGLVALWKAKKPFVVWWQAHKEWRRARDVLPSEIAQIMADVKAIRGEVQFNGGHSLKDVVRENGFRVSLEIASRRLTSSHATWEGRVRVAGDSVVEPEFVSQAWTRLTGMTNTDTANGGWAQCVAIEDRPRVLQEAHVAGEEQSCFHTEYTCINVLDGKRTRVSHIGRPLFDGGGIIYGWVGLMVPIKEDTPHV